METGTRLGPYEVLEQLGAGGMGQVWLAQDVRLGRRVALKVLPAQFASDRERLARFEQEAKALAALNHPNIAQVYGLEQADAPVIAMEWVDGRDLARVLAAGPLPLDETLRIARQIAAALGAAHDAGIVHRDLKPGNVVLRADGVVKVLDFGLAKTGGATGATGSALTESPTILTPAMTATGVIMGTAAYMAPEQAKGRSVDRRADIWAFGCVLYEMLVGTRPFGGDDVAEVLASVIKDPARLDALPVETPASIRRLLARCLKKDPAERLDSMAVARFEIEDVAAGAAPEQADAPTSNQPIRVGPVIAAASAGIILGALLWSFLGPGSGPSADRVPTPVRRSVIPLPDGSIAEGRGIAISHDGSKLVINAGAGDQSRLYLRHLDSSEVEPLAGTDGASRPFFSPDDQFVGFVAGGILKKVSVGGGRDVTSLCDAPVSTGGVWDASGWIYFTWGESRLARVREGGGEPEELGEVGNVYSLDALPGGRGILLTLQASGSPSIRKDTSTIAVLSPDGTVTPVLEGGYGARYLSSGHLLFMRGGGLFAAPFDLDALATTGPAVSMLSDVFTDSIWGLARYDVASDGTLVYIAGGDYARTVPTWIDLQTGQEEPLPIPVDVYNNFDLSSDGTQLAIQHAGGAQDQIYLYDSRRGTFSRLTLEGANSYPVWSHDGRELFFASSRDGKVYRLYRQPVDGSAPASRLLTDEQETALESDLHWPTSVTPDGQLLLFMTFGHQTRGGDLWKVALDGSGGPEVVLATEANEIIPQVSPDGSWLAYLTDRAGPYRIIVRPFPDVQRREWVVSGEDGYDPRWSPRGDALLYRETWGRLMRISVSGGSEFIPGVAEQLFQIGFHDASGSSFAVSPDGRRVLVNRPATGSMRSPTPITLVTGWADEVSRLAGPGQ